jgi:DNA-binding beta-propeller fold protein YncE
VRSVRSLAILAITVLTGVALLCASGASAETTYAPTISYKSSFGSSGSGNGQFKYLTDIAIDPTDGSLWATDDGNNRIQHFNAAGEYLGQFASCAGPASVAINASGSLYVACSNAYTIQKYNAKGESLKQVAGPGGENGHVSFPLDLAFDSQGNLWVADTQNNRVQEFNTEDKFVKAVSLGEWSNPWGVDVAPDGRIWVAEPTNHRISVFNQSGEVQQRFGAQGSARRLFERATDVEVDNRGYVWVTDAVNDRVQVFTEAGEFVAQFGTKGTGEGQFNTNWYLRVAVGSNGDVWVSDDANARVEKWNAHLISAQTEAATSVKKTEATLHAQANPAGVDTHYQFEYGVSTNYGKVIPLSPADIGSGTTNVAVEDTPTGLIPGVTYHFRVVTTSEAGTIRGEDRSFTTPTK